MYRFESLLYQLLFICFLDKACTYTYTYTYTHSCNIYIYSHGCVCIFSLLAYIFFTEKKEMCHYKTTVVNSPLVLHHKKCVWGFRPLFLSPASLPSTFSLLYSGSKTTYESVNDYKSIFLISEGTQKKKSKPTSYAHVHLKHWD